MALFAGLKERAQLKAVVDKSERDRLEEVQWLFRKVVEEALPEIEDLGFIKVKLFTYETIPSFTLRIQTRRGYEQFTHNLEVSGMKRVIYYGSGANSIGGPHSMTFDINWNNSKLVGAMKSVLRHLVAGALESLEICNARGWNTPPGRN